MDIKPIKTDRDYRRALKAVERLMDARIARAVRHCPIREPGVECR